VPDRDERRSIVRRVRTLAGEGLFQLPSGAEPRDPLPVRGPDGYIHSWMVPFVANGKLIAWAQLGRALEFLRFSLVAGGRIDASPDAADWLDSERVSARIAGTAGTSDFLAPPVLTYDRDPSRLVWAAEVRTPDGRSQRWFVAGTNVWRDIGAGEITGGSSRSR
jgi:hypothetical protein